MSAAKVVRFRGVKVRFPARDGALIEGLFERPAGSTARRKGEAAA